MVQTGERQDKEAAANCRNNIKEESEEEEVTTVSWTSSMASLSPENPVFPAKACVGTAITAHQPRTGRCPSGLSSLADDDGDDTPMDCVVAKTASVQNEVNKTTSVTSSAAASNSTSEGLAGTTDAPGDGGEAISNLGIAPSSELTIMVSSPCENHHNHGDDLPPANGIAIQQIPASATMMPSPVLAHTMRLTEVHGAAATGQSSLGDGGDGDDDPLTMESSSSDEDDNEGSLSLPLNNNQNPLLHHQRQPTTIVESSSEDGDEGMPLDDEPSTEEETSCLSRKILAAVQDELKQSNDSPESLPTSKPLSDVTANRLENQQSLGGATISPCTTGSFESAEQPRERREETPPQTGSFSPLYSSTKYYANISKRLLRSHYDTPFCAATWIGFWALLHVTCATYVLTPMRDAIALQVGVQHIPKLTLASTLLAFCSSVPIGWLFEAPDPNRRRLFKRMGLTRGETQGTSLALFYRFFAFSLLSYAVGFELIEFLSWTEQSEEQRKVQEVLVESVSHWWPDLRSLCMGVGQIIYIAFFLVVHLMKLHSLSLVWGVTTEAMEYEDVARKRSHVPQNAVKTRLQRLALVGFGGTMGGILGSVLASSMAHCLRLSGLLVVAALMLEVSAELAIELGRIMQKHWEEQQLFQSSGDLTSLDTSMRRSASLGSMKRVASGNSLSRVKSADGLSCKSNAKSSDSPQEGEINDNTFLQRLLRGVTTILRSRLLMAIFTYNALYASTTVLLSFQRAALVANRHDSTTKESNTAFLANVNIASSVAIFALQATGLGAAVAQTCGARGTLALMPLIRLMGVMALAWWHQTSNGKPPNLLVFLFVDECCKIMNLAVAKPVRESLWRGLSNEARYEAKPIVDTIANRWGGGSAAFLVAVIHRALDLFGVLPGPDGSQSVFGFPPILFLCMVIATWWVVVSADLGQIRSQIDLELKKVQ